MEQSLLHTETKPGPKTTIKDVEAQTKTTEERVQKLEELIARMAHYNGTSNQLLIEYGIEPWTPQKKHMSKHHGNGVTN